jgi:hypothetical protein
VQDLWFWTSDLRSAARIVVSLLHWERRAFQVWFMVPATAAQKVEDVAGVAVKKPKRPNLNSAAPLLRVLDELG